MIRNIVILISLTAFLMILSLPGCEKEKIVESTEYIHDVEYVELPADTVFRVDTVLIQDSITIENTDTVVIIDTVTETDHVYDTSYVYDTVVVANYDTVVVTDTVTTVQCEPNEYFAVTAMQYYCDPVVIQVINQEYGINDGWVFYLSTFQLDLTQQSTEIYDMYGFIDYWTPDWSGLYAFEFYWRMVYTGGDPADVNNWEMIEPPVSTAAPQPGVRLAPDGASAQRALR
ncbi:MAG: hypothetical protein JSV52_08305 [Candidatus Zixiibacteriota bacterium]|nr:MAG: hypothetical protein JSV52_08305 [candidate division Zixibacteria bacterium]